MEPDHIRQLLYELTQRSECDFVDEELFIEALVNSTPPDQDSFYSHITGAESSLEQVNNFYRLTLDLVLRNDNGTMQHSSWFKRIRDRLTPETLRDFSVAWSRDLRKNNDLITYMMESPHPYSLLGTHQTFDYSDPNKEAILVVSRPILILHGASMSQRITKEISKWESKNTSTNYQSFLGLPIN